MLANKDDDDDDGGGDDDGSRTVTMSTLYSDKRLQNLARWPFVGTEKISVVEPWRKIFCVYRTRSNQIWHDNPSREGSF